MLKIINKISLALFLVATPFLFYGFGTAILKAVDAINQKFGKDTVRFGSVKTTGRWKMKQTRKSRNYTTNWNELLVVN